MLLEGILVTVNVVPFIVPENVILVPSGNASNGKFHTASLVDRA